ncbi:hypothetical protein [Micromonospora sp. NPDC047730]|uniref:hypothetical protein n=1 Tax=Micromonospora sp. NPDC047730 TaxID=3364253 RepID=UPI0037241EA9
MLRKLITDDTGELRTRVAAILPLLYAQPLDRILSLTIDDIDTTGADVLLRIGDPPTPVPELLLAMRDQAPTCASPPTATPAGSSPAAAPANP